MERETVEAGRRTRPVGCCLARELHHRGRCPAVTGRLKSGKLFPGGRSSRSEGGAFARCFARSWSRGCQMPLWRAGSETPRGAPAGRGRRHHGSPKPGVRREPSHEMPLPPRRCKGDPHPSHQRLVLFRVEVGGVARMRAHSSQETRIGVIGPSPGARRAVKLCPARGESGAGSPSGDKVKPASVPG